LYGDPSLSASPSQPFFPNLLARGSAPAPDEVAFWTDSAWSFLDIEANIAASQEYFNKAQTR